MKPLASLLSFASVVFRRSRLEGEMEEELRLHVQERADDLERSGLSRAEAERRARLEFGGFERYKEESREALGAHFLETLLQDVRFGLRLLRKSPGFTAVAVLTLALGIGANTAIFSLVYAVLLRPLPYAHPEQLVIAFEDNVSQGVKITGCSYPDLEELQKSGVFSSAAGIQRHDLTLTGAGDPTPVSTVVVTPEIFPLLQTRPVAGRYFLAEDGIKGSAPVVLLSEGLWRTRFGGDLKILDHPIILDQKAFTVVGIMPRGFRVPVFGPQQEIWISLAHDPLFSSWMTRNGGHWLRVVGRLHDGRSLASSQSEVDSISRRLASESPADHGGWAAHLAPLQTAIVDDVRTPLLILLGAVGLVLLLACVNIANLLLARATSRSNEVAMRQALGARRGRIVRQLLTESALLGLLGAGLGIAFAYWSAHLLGGLLPADTPAMRDAQLDGWVLGFAFLLSLAASLVFGLAPALVTAGGNVMGSLKDGVTRSGSGGGRLRVRSILAAAEIAMAVVLVAGAGLLARSLLMMTSVDPGFVVAHSLKAQVSLPRYRYSTQQQWSAFSESLLQRIQSQPGLQDSAFAVPLPITDGFINLQFSIADHAPLPPGTPNTADYVSVSPEYFRVMGVPLLQGRVFTPEDSMSSPRVAIISESFARHYFSGENPIGKRLVFGFPPDPDVSREIVGVAGGVRDVGLNQEPGPMMYVPFAQAPFWGGSLVVKSTLPPSSVVGTIREVVRSMDQDLPVTDVATMPEALDASVAEPKFRTWLLSAFGLLALFLAAAGIFGVVSYSVASRTREFGVRAALGASPSSIRTMILREGITLGGAGLGAGLLAALGLARFLKTQLYGVTAYDPLTFISSAAILLGVALVACYIPARRAMRVDPMVALRCE